MLVSLIHPADGATALTADITRNAPGKARVPAKKIPQNQILI
jgi:hypothetical protein